MIVSAVAAFLGSDKVCLPLAAWRLYLLAASCDNAAALHTVTGRWAEGALGPLRPAPGVVGVLLSGVGGHPEGPIGRQRVLEQLGSARRRR
jgi:hypothetical protein